MIDTRHEEVVNELKFLQSEKSNPKKDILGYYRSKQQTTEKTRQVSVECLYLRQLLKTNVAENIRNFSNP